ncbi:MAG: amino acid adenylation domain-containing protein [Scytonema sp. PMC 1069.18]|nr:amino acid adenylation domain-containing protein [Scytonema sp. PMC 1069.18]MEC4885100.1 amino acid adenylation domain-containing protein [Scytonema sp. PMC 1070.18]
MNLSENNDFELLELLLEEEGIYREEDQFQIKHCGVTTAPASYQQRRLWFLYELEPTSSAYNICAVFRLDGLLEIEALQLAFQQLQQRHESLRTTFMTVDGEPWQKIHLNVLSELIIEDWRDVPETEIEQRISAIAPRESQYSFDLEKGPLSRMRLYRVTPVQNILALTFHHIIADGWSLGIIIEELATLYHFALQGDVTGLEELKIQYADYAIWQKEKYSDSVLEAHLAYWEKQLAQLPVLQFPTEFPRPRLQSFQGDLFSFSIPDSLTADIRQFTQNEDVTLFMTLMAAFSVFLGRYSGQEDIPVGTSIANRPGIDSERLIGFFVNMLVIRADLSGEPSFRTLVKRVKETVLQGFEHTDVPFETLVERLHVDRDTSRNPLFQIAFTLLNAPKTQLTTGSLAVTPLANQEAARFDLELFVTETQESLSAVFSYNTDLFSRETVESFARHFCNLLEHLVTQADTPVWRLPILLPEEYAKLMPTTPSENFPVQLCLHEVFSQQVALRPSREALIFENESLTYGQLNERANRLAHHLIHLGVQPESRVGLWLNRSIDMVVAILGVLKAGGTYVPLDPDYPSDRVIYMLEDSQVSVLLTQAEFPPQLPPHQAQVIFIDQIQAELNSQKATNPEVKVYPDNAAYIIYTSGSTGKPKGVVVTHRNVVRLMLATEKWFHFNQKDVWTLFHSYAFDFSVWEMWGAFFFGGRLIIIPYLVSRSPEDFYNLLCDRKVTVLNQTPSAFRQLIQAEEVICRESELNLRYVIFGGEALDLGSLEPWFDRHSDDFPQLVNMYGITETTVHVTYRPIRLRDVKKRQGSLIGQPIPDNSLYILDAYGQPVPVGVVGEIYVGGAGVTRGYLNRPQLTAERMVPNPAHPQGQNRLYRTGDLGRYRLNGEIEYLGRNDHQVKIRGFRVELGEVEAILQYSPGVRIARALPHKQSQDDFRLIAYIVPQTDLTKIPEYGELKREQTEEWQFTFDETYRIETEEVNEDFNIAGWNSSYDGQPISPKEMREWLDNTLAHIQALKPQRVLEVGCGTGMILLNIAPYVESYWASDFSQQAISRLENITKKRQLSGVRLFHREALDFSDIPQAYFDTIVINSVAQYFPSLEYFQQVIAGALNAVAPGGSIFIGDNRNLPHLGTFYISVAFAQATDDTDRQTFVTQVQRIAEKENELVIDPAFFVNLPKVFPTVDGVEVYLKGERAHNELSKYRYDVIIHTKEDEKSSVYPEVMWSNWQTSNLQLTDLRQYLESRHGLAVGWRGIPNARIVQDEAILQWSQGNGESATVGELRKFLHQLKTREALDPADLLTLAQDLGYQVSLSYSKDFGSSCFDACFYQVTNTKQKRRCPQMPMTQDSVTTKLYSMNPLQGRFAKALITELKQQVREQLPEYMRPSSFVVLDSLPMTASGKLDVRSLPQPENSGAIAKNVTIQPTTETQQKLSNIWKDVLGVEFIGVEDDFFALGGHSLLATKLVSRIREEFNAAFALRKVFEYPTIAGLAQEIDTLVLQNESVEKTTEEIPRVTQRENLPLSFPQQRLWFLDKLEPNNPAYNIMVGFRLNGQLNQEALHRSLQEIVKRHEVLRTTFAQDTHGNPIQIIHEFQEIPLLSIDLSHWSSEEREEQLQKAVMTEALRPFNLASDTLLRVYLYRLEENDHVFVAVMHHIVSDGWSFGLMVKELSSCYTAFCLGQESPFSPLSLQYADFAHWQRTTFEQSQLQKQLDYWKQELSGELQSLELLTDFLRPAIANYQGRTVSFTVDSKNYENLKHLCSSQGVTLFMGLLGVFKTLLMRYSQQHDILVGTPIANRNRKQTEDLIGFFVNTLVIRTDLSGNPSFTTLLERLKEKTLQAYAHQDLPFERLVEELQPERNLSHNPLFQVMFVLQNAPMGKLELPGLTLTPLELESVTAKFDLTLSMTETETGLEGKWEYKTDLFEAATVTRMAEHFQTLLEAIVANPNQNLAFLPLLSTVEQNQILEWNNTKIPYPQDWCIHQMIEAQVERTPNAVAVVFEEQQLTYRELNTQANQLAHYLQALGVKPDTLVGICVERSLEMLVGVLGILKAGAAYLPLDPTYPQDRLAFMLSDAQTPVLLTQQFLVNDLPENDANIICLDTFWEIIAQESEENPTTNVISNNLAYVIYTSGSTGKPKGVQISHQNLVHSLIARFACYSEPVTNFLLLSSLAFDASIPGIFWTLCQGGTLYLPEENSQWEMSKLIQMINQNSISHLISLPSLYKLILEQANSAEQLASLKTVIVVAEACSKELVRYHAQKLPKTSLLNEYGPTEGTVWSSVYNLYPHEEPLQISIGRPIANTQFYILDKALQPLPIGVPGELYIHGVGLTRGYLNRPELTAEKFIPNPFSHEPGERLYKTGDLACYLADGNVEFLGRIDNQVKIRGYRIELGEIEAVLCQHSSVREAVAIVNEDTLVAYVTAYEEQILSTNTLRRFLQEKLPDYMIPASFVILDTMPLMPNGKVDRKALRASNSDTRVRSSQQIPPRTLLEQKLVQLWEETLQISPIGVTENFFDLGGHSLLAIRLLAEIEKHLGYSLPLVIFFREGTIEKIAAMLERESEPKDSQLLIPLQTKGDRRPLFLIHQHGGYGLSYSQLAQTLRKEQPLYALQARGLDGKQQPLDSIEAMASAYLQAIREILPHGPYSVGGHSFGGLVAFEMASQLEAQGEEVENLLIIDTHPPLPTVELEASVEDDTALLAFLVEQIGLYVNETINISQQELLTLKEAERLDYVLQILRTREVIPPDAGTNFVTGFINVYKANSQAIIHYQPKPIRSPLSVFKTQALAEQFPDDPTVGWHKLAPGQVQVYSLIGDHNSILREPHVQHLAEAIQKVVCFQRLAISG